MVAVRMVAEEVAAATTTAAVGGMVSEAEGGNTAAKAALGMAMAAVLAAETVAYWCEVGCWARAWMCWHRQGRCTRSRARQA